MTEIFGFLVVAGFLAAATLGGGGVEHSATVGINESTFGVDETDTSMGTEEVASDPAPEVVPEVNMGKFTTAGEIRMILDATKGNWVAVREFDGQDLLYFTHLESWRCGLTEIRYRVNSGDQKVWTTDPCYIDEPAPNALKMENGHLPYTNFALKSVETVEVTLFYDDGDVVTESFERKNIMTP